MKNNKRVIDILKEELAEMGADGLCSEECGCGLGDLVPCQSDPSQCMPAVARPIRVDCEEDRFWIQCYDMKPGDVVYVEMDQMEGEKE